MKNLLRLSILMSCIFLILLAIFTGALKVEQYRAEQRMRRLKYEMKAELIKEHPELLLKYKVESHNLKPTRGE